MKKLRLDAEKLTVESFPTASAESIGGTVHAHAGTVVGLTCPAAACQTYDDTVCGLTRTCGV